MPRKKKTAEEIIEENRELISAPVLDRKRKIGLITIAVCLALIVMVIVSLFVKNKILYFLDVLPLVGLLALSWYRYGYSSACSDLDKVFNSTREVFAKHLEAEQNKKKTKK